jgi:CheY-like chemotaxis protein
MSHEIRTPLAAIIGFASILNDEVSEQHRRFISFIERSGKRLLETLNSILNLSMLESGAVKLNREVVHVAQDVLQQSDRLRPLAEEKAIALEVVLPDEDAQAFLDPACLDRILYNLIGNAIKFTEKGGVTVTVSTHKDQVVVAVQDTGVGIDPEFLPYLFSDFKQETMGEDRSYEGIGLGLAITKRMVELLEGTIQVETEKGVGSTFTVMLPRLSLKHHDTGLVEQGSSNGAEPSSGRPRLLVVEDNPEMLVLLKHYLASHFDVSTAPDIHTALDQGPPRRFDLVLMDVNLGDRGAGVEDLVDLRRVEAYRRTPAVAVTAFALPGDRERFTAAGFDAYLGRPFTRQQLFETLDPLLAGSIISF